MPLRWLITPVVFVGAVLLHHRIESQHIASSPPLPPSVDDGAPLNVAEIPGHIPAIERAPQAYATERLDWTHHRPE
jgi:hypothetical protein